MQAARATDAIINSKSDIHLRTGQYNNTDTGGTLDNEVMTAFCSLLEKVDNKRPSKILTPAFYEALTYTNGAHT